MTLSRQQMFDLAFIGLRNQGFVPAYEHGRCRYLTEDGRRCAWGHVDTSLSIETESVYYVGNPEIIDIDQDGEFALELQNIHDYSAATCIGHDLLAARRCAKYNLLPTDLEGNLHKFAAFHGLTVPD